MAPSALGALHAACLKAELQAPTLAGVLQALPEDLQALPACWTPLLHAGCVLQMFCSAVTHERTFKLAAELLMLTERGRLHKCVAT